MKMPIDTSDPSISRPTSRDLAFCLVVNVRWSLIYVDIYVFVVIGTIMDEKSLVKRLGGPDHGCQSVQFDLK